MRIAPMQRVPWRLKPLVFMVRRMFGKVLTPYLVYGRRPGILMLLVTLMAAVEYSKAVDPRTKRLTLIRTAQLIGCPF